LSLLSPVLAAVLLQAAPAPAPPAASTPAPTVLRPTAKSTAPAAPPSAAPPSAPPVASPGAVPPRAAPVAPTAPATTAAPTTAAPPTAAPPTAAPTTTAPAAAPAPAPVAATAPAPVATPTAASVSPAAPAPVAVPAEKQGPPFYSEADMEALRRRYGLEERPAEQPRRPKFRCLVADPSCGFVVEIHATSGYAYRVRQGRVDVEGDVARWNSARVQYDIWLSIPTMVETRGKLRYTRLSLGPKGGVIASDGRDIWGNVGLAGRYWFGRGKFAPNIEFTSALAFKVFSRNKEGEFGNVRGPIGFTADVGFGLGGFGAIVVGGQFDSALAREDAGPLNYVAPGGMFFVGFRGNILWGAPAALAVGTHAAATRLVQAPL
jgi:hypothetical protein